MIIYLHGFNSTGASAKGRFLKENFATIPVLTPTYDFDPRRAVPYLKKLVQQQQAHNHHIMLVGSSLGGYYAQYLAHHLQLKMVLINPALLPLSTLTDYLGENTNYYTGETYILTQAHLDALLAFDLPSPCSKPVPTLLLVDKGDEVLDYHVAVNRYQDCAEIILFDDGDHQFQHLTESLPAIEAFYYR